MITIQVVPNGKNDAYKLLRDKVSHDANTWSWANKAKTKLVHKNAEGYIEVDSADGVVVARIYPKDQRSEEVLIEKFIGRFVAWFQSDLSAMTYPAASGRGIKDRNPIRTFRRRAAEYVSRQGINVQFIVDSPPKGARRKPLKRS